MKKQKAKPVKSRFASILQLDVSTEDFENLLTTEINSGKANELLHFLKMQPNKKTISKGN